MQIWIFLKLKKEKRKKICIFLRCKSEFFFKIKGISIFLRCRSKFFSNQNWFVSFLRYKSGFFFFNITCVDFWNKEKYFYMIVFAFVLFNSCCINLNYEWNSLLKKIFFIFFLTYKKNIFDFSAIKNQFFVFCFHFCFFLLLLLLS